MPKERAQEHLWHRNVRDVYVRDIQCPRPLCPRPMSETYLSKTCVSETSVRARPVCPRTLSECRKICIIYHIWYICHYASVTGKCKRSELPLTFSLTVVRPQHCALPSKMRATAKREAWQCGWSANPTRCASFASSNRCLFAHAHRDLTDLTVIFIIVQDNIAWPNA